MNCNFSYTTYVKCFDLELPEGNALHVIKALKCVAHFCEMEVFHETF